MMEIIGNGSNIFETYKVTQESAETAPNKLLDALKAVGAPEEDIQEIELELHGGECPYCHKPWKEKQVTSDVVKHDRVWDTEKSEWIDKKEVIHNLFGSFKYFIPTCHCIHRLQAKRAEDTGQKEHVDFKLMDAHIPRAEWKSTWATWDYRVKPAITESMRSCKEWTDRGFWKEGRGLILCGGVGTGKTRCAVMMAQDIIEKEANCALRFLPMADLLSAIIRDETKGGFIDSLLENKVLIIDDMDKVPSDKEWARSQVFSFYDSCIREGISLIGTTNLNGPDEMSEKFDYTIVSRLMGRCLFIPFKGDREDDYRILRRKYETRRK
jgi:DNA replication protein DnaC